ncbi:MAG: tetratricopeptide repeat protein [Acidobacteriota bacterium]|jgi:tetratricopeptide (TPR) repeat protein/class 3 adenylate cyclase
MIGNTVSHYRILNKLGQGGMGEVFLALDTSLNRKVALKFLTARMSNDPSARQRILREAKSAAALDHPFICKVYEASHSEGQDFIATELLEEHRRRLRPIFRRHNGEEVKAVAGAFAVEFSSVVSAAQCAVEVQKCLRERNQALAPERRIQLRAGLHLGDVIHQGSDGLGDGINTADQLRRLAVPAGICVSEDVSNQIRDRVDLRVEEVVQPDPGNSEQSIRAFRIVLPWNEPTVTAPVQAAAGKKEVRTARAQRSFSVPRKLVAGVSICALAVAAWFVWQMLSPPSTVLGFQERDWIVLADFENQTGEDIFEKSLDTALRVSLEQSSSVNVLPKSRIEETLRRMKKQTVARIDEPLAKEIAQREGVKILLVPSIAGVAGTYLISATLEDAATGDRLKSESVRVQGKEKILGALDTLVRNARRDLGESRGAISRQGKDLAKATTFSLDALKQFSLGIEAHKATRFEQARTCYENAVALDPEFAAAIASLGMIHYEQFDREKGKQLLGRAVRMVDNLTNREKYSVLAFYARAVENDIPKAIQHWKVLAGMYPDDAETHNNIAWFDSQLGKNEEAIAEYKEAIRINPYLGLSYNGLNIIYLYQTGQASAALDLCLKHLAFDDQDFWTYSYLGWAALGIGDLERARAALEKAIELNHDPNLQVPGLGNPYQINLYRLAHTLRLQRKYPEALQVLQRVGAAFSDPLVDYEMGAVCQLIGDRAKAASHLEKYRSYVTTKEIPANPAKEYGYLQLALVSQRLGRPDEAQAAFRKAVALDLDDHFGFAQFHSLEGKPDVAVHELELAIQKGWRNHIWTKINSDFQNLYDDQRFRALLASCLK